MRKRRVVMWELPLCWCDQPVSIVIPKEERITNQVDVGWQTGGDRAGSGRGQGGSQDSQYPEYKLVKAVQILFNLRPVLVDQLRLCSPSGCNATQVGCTTGSIVLDLKRGLYNMLSIGSQSVLFGLEMQFYRYASLLYPFHILVEELDGALHGGAEVVGDVVVVAIIFIEFHVLLDVQHLV
jgi:hypothetical protein